MRKLILFVTLCGLVISGNAFALNWVAQRADPGHWPYADGPLVETPPARNSGYRGASIVANGQIAWVGFRTLTDVRITDPASQVYWGNRQSGFSIFTPTAVPAFGTTYGGTWNSAFGGDDIDNGDGTWTSFGLCGYNNGRGNLSPMVGEGTGYTMGQGFAYDSDGDGTEEIYVMGGYPQWGDDMARYDPDTNSWSSVELGDSDGLYMDGGGVIGSHWYKVHKPGFLMDYDLTTDTYAADIAIANLPDPGFGAASAVVNNLLYVFDNSDAAGVVYEIDPIGATFATKSAAPIPVREAAAVVYAPPGWGDLVYLLGGRTEGAGSSNIDNIQIYNPATDTWFLSPDKIPTKRSGQLSAILEGRLYLGQGYSDDGVTATINDDFWYANMDEIRVPEPSTILLIASGILGLLFLRRKK
jgi:hypothetical protein